jgi:hypothetical protein
MRDGHGDPASVPKEVTVSRSAAPHRRPPAGAVRGWRHRLATLPVAGLAALVLGLSGCGDDEIPADAAVEVTDTAPAEPAEDDATTPEGTDAAPSDAPPGSLIVNGESVFELAARADAASALEALAGEPAFAADVEVLSAVPGAGFWIGTPDSGRMWVQVTAADETPVDVAAGDLVSFTGILVSHDQGYVDQLGLPAEDAEQLTSTGHHIEIPDVGDLTVG